VEVARPATELLRAGADNGEASGLVRSRVEKAWALQQRQRGINNARLKGDDLDTACKAGDECWKLLERAAEQFNLSARAHQRVLRVSRTIADLAGDEKITPPHIAEALSLRCLDRQS
jgi:magnesium chelatase family protein